MSSEMQMNEQNQIDSGMDGKQQGASQGLQTGYPGSGFANSIPITAQAGVIDGMEE